ncbi:hypothetical protein C1H46_006535 [Malus baccata]|uniref:Uncharacterized protein n=1 Tax=Malus baccata TaxID=106549 RepID=A0A540NA06_MALBA|nr:hypothetical protein C1H46_006535 [Malus baccata]
MVLIILVWAPFTFGTLGCVWYVGRDGTERNEAFRPAFGALKMGGTGCSTGQILGVFAFHLSPLERVRPVVETGYENLLLVRLLLEMRMPSIRESSVAEGLTMEGILEKWSELKPVIMAEWGVEMDALIHLFGKVRDEWMDEDLTTWIGANRNDHLTDLLLGEYSSVFRPCHSLASSFPHSSFAQARFGNALLRELAGVTIPPEKIFGLGSGPKVEELKQLQKKPEHQGLKLHFVEDQLAILKNVIKEPELDGWNLYLGNWGYNTQKEREEAETIPRIQIVELSDFSKKLK